MLYFAAWTPMQDRAIGARHMPRVVPEHPDFRQSAIPVRCPVANILGKS
ncbi:MAG: hypothetical protein ACYDDO_06670 [Acidiferrobacterales bacterium]